MVVFGMIHGSAVLMAIYRVNDLAVMMVFLLLRRVYAFCDNQAALVLFTLIDIVALAPHRPYSPVDPNHNSRIEVPCFPFQATESVLAWSEQDVVFTLDSVDRV